MLEALPEATLPTFPAWNMKLGMDFLHCQWLGSNSGFNVFPKDTGMLIRGGGD